LHKNKLFPSIEESIQLNLSLEDILRDNIESKLWFDNEIRSRKLNEKFIVYEKAHQIGNQIDKLFNFIDWALQLNRPVLEEGRIIKTFVDEKIFLSKEFQQLKEIIMVRLLTLPNNKTVYGIFISMKFCWIGRRRTCISECLQIRKIYSF
jgi:hypothetical protein